MVLAGGTKSSVNRKFHWKGHIHCCSEIFNAISRWNNTQATLSIISNWEKSKSINSIGSDRSPNVIDWFMLWIPTFCWWVLPVDVVKLPVKFWRWCDFYWKSQHVTKKTLEKNLKTSRVYSTYSVGNNRTTENATKCEKK